MVELNSAYGVFSFQNGLHVVHICRIIYAFGKSGKITSAIRSCIAMVYALNEIGK